MCGIGGRSSRRVIEAAAARGILGAMEKGLARRGPDGTGVHVDEETALVHRRLAIIDLSDAGAQPLWNEDHTVCVLVNGEVYNFIALRKALEQRGHRFRSRSDSEVLVHLYEDEGISGCSRAEGMFAYVLWDSRSRDLYLVRDRLGIKPLILSEHSEGVTFASTLPALLGDNAVPRDLCDDALLAMLKWGFIPSPLSAVRAARRVMPGTWVRIREGRIVEERTWWVDAPTREEVSERELRTAIEDSVLTHLVADVPVGALLSSGIDSGLVAGLASRSADIAAWTVSQTGHRENEYPEAQRAATHFGIPIHEIALGEIGLTERALSSVVLGMDEPLGVASQVGLHMLYDAISANRRVVLTGDGGDELFGGYDWHRAMPALPWWAQSAAFRHSAPLLSLLAERPGKVAALGTVARHVRRHPASVYLDKLRLASEADLRSMNLPEPRDDAITLSATAAWERFEGAGTLEQMLAVDRATALVDEMLAKVDAASMSYSVEARVPLLADGVLRAAKGISKDRKHDGVSGKKCLRDWYGEIGPLGANEQPKKGFNSPLDAWVAREEFLHDRILAGAQLLSARAPTTNSRLMFACAVLGTWNEHVRSHERRVA